MTKSAVTGGMLPRLLAPRCVLILSLLLTASPCILASEATSTRRHHKKIVVAASPSLSSSTHNSTASFVPPTIVAKSSTLTKNAAVAALAQKTTATTLRVCVLVEPSPFSYCSGYSNRFQQLLRHLESRQDDVQVVTAEIVHQSPPREWLGFPVHYTAGVPLPYYSIMSLSTDIYLKIARVLARMRPDLIHVSSPGSMVAVAVFWSRLFQIPLISR
jgi:Glycosyl transferase 4-like domain